MLRILIVTLAFLHGVNSSFAGEALHLLDRQVSEGRSVRLAELLEEGEEAPFAYKVVTEAPAPGGFIELSRVRLQRKLWDWGWRGQLEGSEFLRLETPGLVLSTERLQPDVEAKLDEMLLVDGLRRADEVKGWPDNLTLSDSRIRWSLDLRGKRSFRNRSAQLVLTDSRGFEQALTLRFLCEMPLSVAVAAEDMQVGESVRNWVLEERDGFFIEGRPLAPEELEDAVCSREVAVGNTLSDQNVETGILVREGREVEIRLERGPVTVVMRGIAQADGALGDRISVRHLDSKELRRYRVSGRGSVTPSYMEEEGGES